MKSLKTGFLVLCLVVTANLSTAQNLGTALHLNAKEDVREEFPVASITTEMTFYNQSGTIERKKEISTLNLQQRVVFELRYDENGTLTERYTCLYDSTGFKKLGRKLERWHRFLGYTFDISKNEYDTNGFLISTTDKNQNNQISMVTEYLNDERGNPIEINVLDGNGNSFGVTKITYDYSNNLVMSKVYDHNGNLQSENTSKINYEDALDSKIIKNEYGDVIKSDEFEYTYRYDKKGNWVFKTNYKYRNGNKIKQSEFSRKITYR